MGGKTGLATTGSHPIDGRNFPIFFLNGSGISDTRSGVRTVAGQEGV